MSASSRSRARVQCAVLALCLAMPAAMVRADAYFEIFWQSGSQFVVAAPGDTLGAVVVLRAGPEGITGYSLSVEFDQDGEDELDFLSVFRQTPAGWIELGSTTPVVSESSAGIPGRIESFFNAADIFATSPLTPGASHAAGTAYFEVNGNVVSTDTYQDVIGDVSAPNDAVTGSNLVSIPVAIFGAEVASSTPPPTTDVSATKSDALFVDGDGDGAADPGDTLRYTVVISNSGSSDATSVVFTDTPDPNSTLVVGSVTSTPPGTVSVGNTASDSTVQVDIGTLAAGASVTIAFDVVVNVPFPMNENQIANQGEVALDGSSPVPTDDPDTSAPGDPTSSMIVDVEMGLCEADLATCEDDLSTCGDDLGACEGENATCQGDLGTCQGDLGACQGDFGTCQGDLGTCQGDLGTCQGDFGTCQSDLGTCQAALDAATQDSDGDGVPDSFDDCVGTAAGADVDASGCSIEQFCSGYSGRPLFCRLADWRNDEPIWARDCRPSFWTGCSPR